MKIASRSSVAVSFGSRGRNRMTPSRARRAPATIARPSTSSAFANSEPRIDVVRDDDLAGREREQDDEELGQVAERRLEHAGDRRPEPLADRLGRDRDRPRRARRARAPATTKTRDRLGVGEVEHAGDGGRDERRAESRRAH